MEREAALEDGPITRYASPSSGRMVNLNRVPGYNTSGNSTLFFRFGRTHITPG
jgi:hypothetical protein